MKTSTIAFSAASILIIVAFLVSLLKIQSAAALTDSTSTVASSSTAPETAPSDSTPPAPPSEQITSSPTPPSFTLVHITGTKYIDYFTDGTKTYSFPGDPAIDGKLNQPNAPIPSHGGLTWVSTSGMEAYDTPSGDLEAGDYAQEADGSYISNTPAHTYTDATSSVAIPAHIAMSKTIPTISPDTAPTSTDSPAQPTTPQSADSTAGSSTAATSSAQ
jgi:hypothetical protein